jgi:hypothetical protein
MPTIKKVYQSIKENGFLVIALNEGCDRLNLIRHFGGAPLSAKELVENCINDLNVKVEIFSSQEFFYTKDLFSMAIIAGLHLHDAGITAYKDDLMEYLFKHHSEKNGYLSTNMLQTFLVLSKKN